MLCLVDPVSRQSLGPSMMNDGVRRVVSVDALEAQNDGIVLRSAVLYRPAPAL
jgi:hypothetical protein